jgi:hypothetical protein
MITVAPDVNFFLDACRFRSSLGAAVESANTTMQVLHIIQALGPRAGLVINTGDHVLRNIARRLAEPEYSYRTNTRDAWSPEDIKDFVQRVREIAAGTGGRADCLTGRSQV